MMVRGSDRLRILQKRKRIDKLKTITVTAMAVLFAIVFLLPIILTFTNSFMSASEISANYGSIFATTDKGGKVFVSKTVNLKLIPDMITLGQYITVLFKSPEYLFKFWNSVIYTVPIVIVQLGIATLASYGFARYDGRLKRAIFFAYIVMMLMPYQVTLVPNFLVSRSLGLYGTAWSILLPGFFSPFAVYLLTKFMKRIPTEVMEAASIDGANEWMIFSRICMPLCKGGLASIAILVFFDYWNMVEQPLILLPDADKHPLSVFLSKINTGEISLAFAVAVIYLVPPLLIFLYGEDYLVEGISYQGGIKG
ncbi:MAG: carbohydrate ABC transporter permease [Butyrivibrio sp.]|uniref:carbohydrate ABC transporter permease n=1 Tax=Butyrivibrio sp. TaxID=28121 RepID=UPI001B5EAD5D|nr:carbohydrate ABC transporter permease [Butyrivibrio sp.]MBP3274337.1 carbohydrate ABC transporter permease [Butyrivibrio sp.]MBP3782450.1 carbohydrate ABC transporter permease [Butyrivibrio sp.]MBP3813073.1 carbohydrate ABC transporter permease [Butyrivibrio sp.]